MNKKKPLKQPQKKANSQKPIANSQSKIDLHLILLWLIIIIVSIIRYRLITVPFERDEGEYGYIGGLFLHGIAPFKDAYSMKLPGTSFMYAILIAIFGRTNTGVHLGMVFVNATTMFFLFTAFKKLLNSFIGLATASIFGLMAIGFPFDGFAAHATQFICFYSSLAFLFLAEFMKSGKPLKVFLFGLMIGMAFLMKQQAIFLIIFGALILFMYLTTEKKQSFPEILKNLLLFGAGIFIPYVIVVLIIVAAGQFSVFWLWTVLYASTYESVKTLDFIIALFNSSFIPAWDAYYYLWLLALAGLFVLYWSPYTRFQKLLVLTYCLASVLVVSSGFYFRPHYFVAILPSIGLLSGILVEFLLKQIRDRLNILKSSGVSIVILSAIVFLTIYSNRQYFFDYAPKQVCNMCYWGNPFNEAQEIAKYIKKNTNDTDKIAVFGSEPEICFYANRMSAAGYLYTYPLVEVQPYNKSMQEQMIQQVDKSKPPFIVFCYISYSWLVRPEAPKTIFEWGQKYVQDHYTPVGFVDFFSNNGWTFYWNDDIKNRPTKPQPESFIIIYKRNPDSKS